MANVDMFKDVVIEEYDHEKALQDLVQASKVTPCPKVCYLLRNL